MDILEKKITIETDGWSNSEIKEIEAILDQNELSKKALAQFDFGISTAIIIVVSMFGGAILSGIGNSIGKDIWNKLKIKFIERAKNNKHSTIGMRFENENQKIQFNIKTEDPQKIEKAFDTIDDEFKKIQLDRKNMSFYFDPKSQLWHTTEKRAFIKKMVNPIAKVGIIEQGGKKYGFTKKALEEGIPQSIGLPVTLGHGGKQIGEIIKAWMEGEILMNEIGIYEGISDDDLEELEKILQMGGGVSMGLSFNPNNEEQ